jgi:sulfopyruvate decarboxylase TPP-binding subunit
VGRRTGPHQFGIDQHQRIVTLLGDVNHDDALVHIDLRSRQTDAFGVVHGLYHVGNQRLDARIDSGHGLGNFVQFGVWITKNGE